MTRDELRVINKKRINKIDFDNIYLSSSTTLLGLIDPDVMDLAFEDSDSATDIFIDDLDGSRYNFMIDTGSDVINLKFDLSNFNHLFGLPVYRVWRETIFNVKEILNTTDQQKITQMLPPKLLHNQTWLTRFRSIIKIYGEELKKYSQIDNKEKLNWDRIAYKVFCIVCMGDLRNRPVSIYKDSKTKPINLFGQKYFGYRLALYSNEHKLEDEDVILLDIVPELENGIIYYVPKSIRQINSSDRSYLGEIEKYSSPNVSIKNYSVSGCTNIVRR